MILDRHPSQPGNTEWMTGRKFIGYWKQSYDSRSYNSPEIQNFIEDLPEPQDYVDPKWDFLKRNIVIGHLGLGTLFTQWLGYSGCRFCGQSNGSKCLTDGTYVWPQGFSHYLQFHHVRPPEEFVKHVLNIPTVLREELILHKENLKAIHEKWEDRKDCPNKEVHCHEELPWTCVSNDGRRHSHSCDWAQTQKWAEIDSEDKRHRSVRGFTLP